MSYFDELSVIAENMNHIPSDLYTKHGVKRGLRNEDGSGVLVGLTTVSNVVGYKKTDAGVLPVEGEQHFRGIEIRKLVKDMGPHPRYQFERSAYLLLFGENPTPDQLARFNEELAAMRALSTQSRLCQLDIRRLLPRDCSRVPTTPAKVTAPSGLIKLRCVQLAAARNPSPVP